MPSMDASSEARLYPSITISRTMQDPNEVARKFSTTPPQKIEETPRRVRGLFDKEYVFDTTHARLVWEHPYYPLYYIPVDAIKHDMLSVDRSKEKGDGAYQAVLKGERKQTGEVLVFEKGPLEGLVRIKMDALDSWFEEDEPIYVHPRDPYKRIHILPSSRKITVKIDGVTVAESSNNMFLFETMLRPRYYIPKTALNWQYFTDSDSTTRCPYKGIANYYNANINGKDYQDVLWWYRHPTRESALVEGMACFYNEKVDVFIDGVKEDK